MMLSWLSPLFGPQRCDDNSGAWWHSLLFFLFNIVSLQVLFPLEESSGRKKLHLLPRGVSFCLKKEKSLLYC